MPDKRKVRYFALVLALVAGVGAHRAIAACAAVPTAACSPALTCDVRLTTYVLAPGDRFSLLAQRFGMDYDLLRQCNPAVEPHEMRVGDVIVLPLPRSAGLQPDEVSKEIRRGIRGLGRVALTFDAGGDVGALDDLLAVLRNRQVSCSFFITGRWVDRYPVAFQRVVDRGHEVFSHTFTHRSLPELSREEVLEELARTERIFRRTVGRSTRPYFRPPYGDRDQCVLAIAAGAGWQCVYWTLDSRDTVLPLKTPEEIIERVLSLPDTDAARGSLDGAIILFHVAKRSTAQAMGPIIDGLRERGLEPVALTAILQPPRLPCGNDER